VFGLRKNGTTFPFFLAVSKEFRSGPVRYFTGMVRDLSREKQFEAQLRQAQKMEAIGTLAGGVAHDFNNILGGIFGYVELMLEDAEPGSDLHGDLTEMLKACQRGKELVGQILTFSRRNPPKREPIPLPGIVTESLRFLRATIPATVKIRQKIQPDTATVVGDATQIHQILLNLCTNAYQAMGGDGGLLEVALEVVDLLDAAVVDLPAGRYYQLSVSDDGEGMDEDTRARMFEPFFTKKPAGQGTGMGLAVVHGIVRQHGGAIQVTSEPGHGTTVTVFLPIRGGRNPQPADVAPNLEQGRGRILLADDDSLLVKVQSRILANQGYQVTTCVDGAQALAVFRADPAGFDLIITDQTMPNLTGLELAREVLALRADIPILLTTGFADLIPMAQTKAAGIRDILMKPVQKQDLLCKVQEMMLVR